MDTIRHFNKRHRSKSDLEVLRLGDNYFELIYNDPFDHRYESGTRIRTKVNSEGFHEITEFIKSNKITHRFIAPVEQNLRILEVFVEELFKHGGKFQIDMGGLISVTVPKNFPYDIDEIIKNYSIKVSRLG
jgi:hypothetical protein